jgi:predicted amino acid racemase
MSLNSDVKVLEALSNAARELGVRHQVILMVEMGDLREGIPWNNVEMTVEKVLSMAGLGLSGIGTNLACYAGVVPTLEKMGNFTSLVQRIEEKHNIHLPNVSGGNSGNIPLLVTDNASLKDSRVNNLRIGEGILLGLETVERTSIPGTNQDVFTIEAEIIEINHKPSVPDGIVSQNAYGETPKFEDIGMIRRGVAAIGRQDVLVEDLTPLDDGVRTMGSSSDHMVLRLENKDLETGGRVRFRPGYGALVQAFTSTYVKKEYR